MSAKTCFNTSDYSLTSLDRRDACPTNYFIKIGQLANWSIGQLFYWQIGKSGNWSI